MLYEYHVYSFKTDFSRNEIDLGQYSTNCTFRKIQINNTFYLPKFYVKREKGYLALGHADIENKTIPVLKKKRGHNYELEHVSFKELKYKEEEIKEIVEKEKQFFKNLQKMSIKEKIEEVEKLNAEKSIKELLFPVLKINRKIEFKNNAIFEKICNIDNITDLSKFIFSFSSARCNKIAQKAKIEQIEMFLKYKKKLKEEFDTDTYLNLACNFFDKTYKKYEDPFTDAHFNFYDRVLKEQKVKNTSILLVKTTELEDTEKAYNAYIDYIENVLIRKKAKKNRIKELKNICKIQDTFDLHDVFVKETRKFASKRQEKGLKKFEAEKPCNIDFFKGYKINFCNTYKKLKNVARKYSNCISNTNMGYIKKVKNEICYIIEFYRENVKGVVAEVEKGTNKIVQIKRENNNTASEEERNVVKEYVQNYL